MEKGKKKINVVDIIIILLILAAAVFFGMKFLGGEKATAVKGDISFTVLVQGVPKASLDDIKAAVPGTQISDGKLIECKIESVTSVPGKVEKIEKTSIDGGTKTTVIPAESAEYVDLTFTLSAKVVKTSLLTEVGSQEVRVGRSFIIKTQNVELNGTVMTLSRAA